MKVILIAAITMLTCVNAWAWQGINLDTGTMIEIKTYGATSVPDGNIEYFDYDLGEIKLGYLNMYEQNVGLIIDLDTGDLIRVQMHAIEQTDANNKK